ncbi:energy-converting hydrogenase Eha subunit E [Vogesella perlucida]|nr:energy-converting hydrogenase Eha subunit E [Vogesella perlucida]
MKTLSYTIGASIIILIIFIAINTITDPILTSTIDLIEKQLHTSLLINTEEGFIFNLIRCSITSSSGVYLGLKAAYACFGKHAISDIIAVEILMATLAWIVFCIIIFALAHHLNTLAFLGIMAGYTIPPLLISYTLWVKGWTLLHRK